MPYGSLLADVVQSSVANTPPQFNDTNGVQTGTLCRAWVNFNGTTSPGTIRASFNVTSVTKNGTGDYTINFTTAMPDTNYSVTGSGCERSASANWFYLCTTLTGFATGSIRIGVRDYNSPQDGQFVGVAIFR